MTFAQLLCTPLVEIGGSQVTARELAAAGVVSGRWPQLEADLVAGLVRVADRPPGAEDIAAQVRAFRRRRRLLSAEDMRAWLSAHELSMRDVQDAAAREFARLRGGADGPDDSTAAPDAVVGALRGEAAYTDVWRELARWLAERLLAVPATDPARRGWPLDDPRVTRYAAAELATLCGASVAEPIAVRRGLFAFLASLDEAHAAWAAVVSADAAVARRLREHELDWTRLEIDEVCVPTAGAGAEVSRQLAEGRGLEDVAAAAGVRVAHRSVLIVDAGDTQRDFLVAAVPGEVIGPVPHGAGYLVGHVVARRPPTPDDTELAERARTELLGAASDRLRAGMITFHDAA